MQLPKKEFAFAVSPRSASLVCGVALLFLGLALGGGTREHIVPVGTLVVGTLTAFGVLGQLQVARQRHEEQTKADLRRRVTESFAKAVEQLGSDKLEVRLGGIYTLERIAKESVDDYWPCIETLTAFVRERARWREDNDTVASETVAPFQEKEPAQPFYPRADIAAVLAVINRRSAESRAYESSTGLHLDLRGTDLRHLHLHHAQLQGANLSYAQLEAVHLFGARLERADLRGAHLEGAMLVDAHLERALLCDAHLERASLQGAHLERADLFMAHLERADLGGAYFEGTKLLGAYLSGANLYGAHLKGADFRNAVGLTQEQIANSHSDGVTILPKGFNYPAHWTSSS